MRIGFLLLGAVLAIGMVASPSAQAGFLNMGFENGTSGWVFFDPPGGAAGNFLHLDDGVNNYQGDDTIPIYYAPEGDYYLHLRPGGPLLWEVGAQTATLSASELEVRGVAAFDSQDFRRDAAGNASLTGTFGNHKARVEIYAGSWTAQDISLGAAGSPVVTPWERSIWNDGTSTALDYKAIGGDGSTSVGPFPDDPWTGWQATLLAPGTYTLAYSIQNGLEPSFDGVPRANALFDVNIPEARPAAFLVVGLSLFVLMGYSRRRRTC